MADVETSEQHKGMACLGRLCPTSSLLVIKRLMVEGNGCLPRLNALMTGAAASEADVRAPTPHHHHFTSSNSCEIPKDSSLRALPSLAPFSLSCL